MGLDPRNFHSTYTSALLPSYSGNDPSHEEPHEKAPYIFSEAHLPENQTPLSQPSSHLWPTNYSKLSTATMFTIFFAGEIFAQKATISIPGEGERNVGVVLQDAYINAFRHVARRLAGLGCILGWDVMNEPHPGFIGLPSLERWNQYVDLHLGVMPSGVQGMVLASGGENILSKGLKLKLPIYHRSWPGPSKVSGYVDYEISKGPRVWLEGRKDIWKEEGVWWWDRQIRSGYSYKKDYFTKHPKTGVLIDFERDFYEPFLRRFLAAIDAARSEGLKDLALPQEAGIGQWAFIEPVPNIGPPTWLDKEDDHQAQRSTGAEGLKICYAPHWYDLRACFEKHLSYKISFDVGALALGSRNFLRHSYFGRLGLLGNYKSQITRFVQRVRKFRQSGKPTPILVGETGVPFNINGFDAYKTGDVHWQIVMLDSVVGAMERVGKGNLNWTLWNFASENYATVPHSGVPEAGDGWNSEDFSLVSRDQATTEIIYHPKTATLDQKNPPRPNNKGIPLTRAQQFGNLYIGARCIGAWVRPYPAKTAGILLKSQFTLANVDEGTRSCWGGTFEMLYTASKHNGLNPEVARKTELFLPAYHFGGEPWTLRIGESRSRWSGKVFATAIVVAGECSGSVVLRPAIRGKISWKYSEAAQSLEIVHSPQLAGSNIQVQIEVGPQKHKIQGGVNHIRIILMTMALGVLLALVFGSWDVVERMKQRREFRLRWGG